MTFEQTQAAFRNDPEIRRILASDRSRGTYLTAQTENALAAYIQSRPELAQAVASLAPRGDGNKNGGPEGYFGFRDSGDFDWIDNPSGVPWYVPVIQAIGGAAVGPLAGAAGAGAGAGAGGAVTVGAETAAGLGAGGVLPLGTGLTAGQMVTPSFAALTGAGAPIAGTAAGTLPGGAAAPVVSPGMAGHGGYTQVVSKAAAGGSIIDRLRRMATTPEGIQSLMSLAPLLSSLKRGTGDGGSDLGTSGIEDQIRRSMELSNRRMEQSQPVYDTLVNMAYGSTPTRQRGAAPAGYAPSPGPQGAYAYQSPRFGGQR